MRDLRPVVLLIATLAVGASCSGSADKASAPPAQASGNATHPASAPISNPCMLLTQEEASVAIGQKLVRNDLQHYGPVTRCRFFDASGDERLWLDAQDAALFDGLAHLPDVRPVRGIGDQALWQHNELATFVHILKGGRMISIGLPRTMATMTPPVESAAKRVASRM